FDVDGRTIAFPVVRYTGTGNSDIGEITLILQRYLEAQGTWVYYRIQHLAYNPLLGTYDFDLGSLPASYYAVYAFADPDGDGEADFTTNPQYFEFFTDEDEISDIYLELQPAAP
ncbi:MAG: hypothetical protein KC561_17340, partial [Myxococcales bacterium]|nr:hypothetical protein [Myxococcales bacterium]